MTTKDSPKNVLRSQAEHIANKLKEASRGKAISSDPAGKLAASISKGEVIFAIVMDDKIIKMTMLWELIRNSEKSGIVEYILAKMREEGYQS